MRNGRPLAVEIPAPERDRPAWVKVGAIAAVGFVVGVAWPRLVGVRVGPSAPGEAAAAASASASAAAAARAAEPPTSPAPTAKASAAPAVASAATSAASMTAPTNASVAPTVSVPKGTILSCKTTDGETKKGAKECGALGALDAIVLPRLRKLATCSGAEGQSGKLSVVVTADFGTNKLTNDIGKTSTVGNLDQITGCVKKELAGIPLGNVTHEHARYTVSYHATFAPPKDATDAPSAKDTSPKETTKNAKKDDGEKAEKAEPKDHVAANPGEAAVAWEVALVRDVPKTGEVLARLPRGTKVKVGALKDGWYGIKFGDGFGTDGYVPRAAIGR